MRKEELRILKLILKTNRLNNIESIQILKEYYQSKKRGKIIDIEKFIRNIVSLYLIPITFGIINIYTAIHINLELEKDLINIAYIILIAIIIFSILLIIYIIFGVKNLSTVNCYTKQRLEKILLEIQLQSIVGKD